MGNWCLPPGLPAIPALHNAAHAKGAAYGLLDQYSMYLSITLRKILTALENRWPFNLLEANH